MLSGEKNERAKKDVDKPKNAGNTVAHDLRQGASDRKGVSKMYKAEVQLNGSAEAGGSPLLMHADDVEWRDQIKLWLSDPKNKEISVAGDDRSPAFTWIGRCYHDDEVVGIPSDNIMTCIRGGATMVTAKGKKTFKSQSQSGVIVNEILWPIEVEGKTIPWKEISKLLDEKEFKIHKDAANKLGFELFVKPAKVGQSKHIRVRPMFSNWKAKGTVMVMDNTITPEILLQFFMNAGAYHGLGDWRPSSPRSPGSFGKFAATINII